MSGKVLYLLISNVEIVAESLTSEEISKHIMSVFFKCFDCKVPKIQILTISKASFLAEKVDFLLIKNKVIPKILLLCDDKDQLVKRAALRFLKGRLSSCDASMAQNNLLKMVERNLVSGNSPSTNFLLLDILKEISSTFSTDVSNQLTLDNCFKSFTYYDSIFS